MEVIVTCIKKHKFINRGFLIGPYCPIYGYGCLLIILLLEKYTSSPIVLFCMAIVICCILEYLTSYLMEKIFHARWWDYSDKAFNINGRICLETMVPFGILGSFVMYVLNPFILNLISYIPHFWLHIIVVILLVIFVTDNVISFNIINSFKNEIKKAESDQTEEITKKIRKVLNRRGILYKRLLGAFPNIKTSKELLLQIQKRINATVEKMNKNKRKEH